MAIDVHAHYYPPAYLEALSKLVDEQGPAGNAVRHTLRPGMRRDPHFSGALDERLALMDAAGIQTQVLSFASPNVWHQDPGVRTDLVRVFNDACAEVARAYPGRF